MKKKLFVYVSILAIFLVILFSSMSLIIAEDDSTASINNSVSLEANPGVTPDSGLYGLKLGWERVRLMFTFNAEKKAEKELELAKLRLVEARVMAERGNENAAEKALLAHNRLISRVEARVEALKEGANEQGVKENIKEIVALEKAIEVHGERIEELKNILADGNISQEKRALIEQKISDIENVTEHLKEVSQSKKDRVQEKLVNMTGKSTEEVEKEIQDIENAGGLNATKKILAEIRIANTERAIQKLEERRSSLNESGANISIFDTHLETAKSLLSLARNAYDAGNYSGVLFILRPVDNFGRQLSPIVREISDARRENNPERVKELVKNAEEKQLERAKEMDERLIAVRNRVETRIEKIENNQEAVAKQFEARVKRIAPPKTGSNISDNSAVGAEV